MKELVPKKEDANNSVDLPADVELLFDTDSSLFINTYFISSKRILYNARLSKSPKAIIFVFKVLMVLYGEKMLYIAEWRKLS
jgi:hypothetical protein